MSRRYKPTSEETQALVDAGWSVEREPDGDVWFWPPGELGYGWTYKQARREQDRRERNARRAGLLGAPFGVETGTLEY